MSSQCYSSLSIGLIPVTNLMMFDAVLVPNNNYLDPHKMRNVAFLSI